MRGHRKRHKGEGKKDEFLHRTFLSDMKQHQPHGRRKVPFAVVGGNQICPCLGSAARMYPGASLAFFHHA
ncbi:protein of unknown function [Aminobacter niigataensis]|nr:protein of unknown function [Aminobacter niigataensis]